MYKKRGIFAWCVSFNSLTWQREFVLDVETIKWHMEWESNWKRVTQSCRANWHHRYRYRLRKPELIHPPIGSGCSPLRGFLRVSWGGFVVAFLSHLHGQYRWSEIDPSRKFDNKQKKMTTNEDPGCCGAKEEAGWWGSSFVTHRDGERTRPEPERCVFTQVCVAACQLLWNNIESFTETNKP